MATENIIADYFLAAEQGNITKLKACLASGVDINASNRQGRTAITLASLNKHYACVSVLIAAGADINKQDQTCFNPFLISCLNNDVELLRLILPANPDLERFRWLDAAAGSDCLKRRRGDAAGDRQTAAGARREPAYDR